MCGEWEKAQNNKEKNSKRNKRDRSAVVVCGWMQWIERQIMCTNIVYMRACICHTRPSTFLASYKYYYVYDKDHYIKCAPFFRKCYRQFHDIFNIFNSNSTFHIHLKQKCTHTRCRFISHYSRLKIESCGSSLKWRFFIFIHSSINNRKMMIMSEWNETDRNIFFFFDNV